MKTQRLDYIGMQSNIHYPYLKKNNHWQLMMWVEEYLNKEYYHNILDKVKNLPSLNAYVPTTNVDRLGR